MLLHLLSIMPLSQTSLRMRIMHWIIEWVGTRSTTTPFVGLQCLSSGCGVVMTLPRSGGGFTFGNPNRIATGATPMTPIWTSRVGRLGCLTQTCWGHLVGITCMIIFALADGWTMGRCHYWFKSTTLNSTTSLSTTRFFGHRFLETYALLLLLEPLLVGLFHGQNLRLHPHHTTLNR